MVTCAKGIKMFLKLSRLFAIFFFSYGVNAMAFELSSPSFGPGGRIPEKYTCDGNNISPPLFWKEAPSGTKSYVLIMEDPDAPAGTWDHWVLFNIPATATSLDENLQQLPQGTMQGNNSWNKLGYGGPCPPDREHRYFFKLYALDKILSLNEGSSKPEIEKAMQGRILGTAELMSKYERKK